MLALSAGTSAETSKPAQAVTLVAPGAEYRYLARTIELPTTRYGQIALHDLDVGRGLASGDRPTVLQAKAAPPPGWPMSLTVGAVGNAPFGSQFEGKCTCATAVSDAAVERVDVLYATHTFSLPALAKLSGYKLLKLRTRQSDGMKAYLNGKRIAIRNLESKDDGLRQTALRAKGPEWETFLIPLQDGMLRSTGNQLSFEVRAVPHRQGVRLDSELLLLEGNQVVRGPMVQRADGQTATIVFDTDLPTKAQVQFGDAKDLSQVAHSANRALARHHRVELSGLSPGQSVRYRVKLQDSAAGETFTFTMPPSVTEPLRFAVYGDMRGGHAVHTKIVESLLAEAIDFVIVTGDLVLRGSDEADWQRFFQVARPLLAQIPYYPAAGNHDTGTTGDEERYMNEVFALWPGPKNRPARAHWHSFDISGVHFVMLDSNHYGNDAQLQWLNADLAQARKAGTRAIFAATHDGPYSRGLHRGNRAAVEHYVPLLRKYDVSLLFAGHDHLYQRGSIDGLNYMVSGGGGAPLYSVRCGVKGRKRCKTRDGMRFIAKEHHYVLVSVFPNYVSACTKRLDRSPLEPCVRYPLRKP